MGGGEPLEGKTILLHAEQGFGDTLQFVRYVPLVARAGAKVVLEAQGPLKILLSQTEGAAAILSRGEPLPPFDLHCPLMSLPRALGTVPETIPVNIPYIRVPDDYRAKWKSLFSASRPAIGLVWGGKPTQKHDYNRSVPLRTLTALFESKDIHFVSLQRELRAGDAELLTQHRNVVDLGRELANFADTAAIIEKLDLVISVDTSVAHLAGALGKPVWVLLSFAGDWHWTMQGRDDAPWYPTARLFRQTHRGDWGGVVALLTDALKDWRGSL